MVSSTNLGRFITDKNGQKHQIIFEAISGSHLYGLNHADSDIDIKGVYIKNKNCFYGINDDIYQISDEKNDVVYYELGRFFELAMKSNPNMIELIATENKFINYKLDLFDVDVNMFLSKDCITKYIGFANSQVKKAKGLKKVIHNPQPKIRKPIYEFCYFVNNGESIHFIDHLNDYYSNTIADMVTEDKMPIEAIKRVILEMVLENSGLVKSNNGRDLYGIYLPFGDNNYRGVIKDENSTELRLSSISKEHGNQLQSLRFNSDGFKTHCKAHKAYWEWVKNRNEARYATNVKLAKNYDTKNISHTFRLLHVAKEIAIEKKVNNMRTKDRDFLFTIKNGHYEYETILLMIKKEIENVKIAFEKSTLTSNIDKNKVNEKLVSIRKQYYDNC
jgi:predicted nucleotidyltransferase